MTISSNTVSRVVALGLLLAVLAAAWTMIAGPLETQRADHLRSAKQSRSLLLRYNRIAAERSAQLSRLERVERTGSTARGFLEGVSPDLVAAELQNRIKRSIGESGGTPASMRILPPEDEGDHKKVAVRVNLECDTTALQELLYGIEAQAPYLFLDNIDISIRKSRARSSAKRQQDVLGAAPLRVRFDVYGYIRGAGA